MVAGRARQLCLQKAGLTARAAKHWIKRLLIASGVQNAIESRNCAPAVLVYHGVSRKKRRKGDSSFIDWLTFREHLRFFRAARSVVPVSQMAQACAAGEKIDPRWISITVDDGLADSCRIIAEEAEKASVPWNLNVPAGLIGTMRTIWSQEVRILAACFPEDVVGISARTGISLLSGSNRFDALVATLMRVEDSRRALWFSELETRIGPGRFSAAIADQKDYRIVSQSELRQLAHAGVDIGVHGMFHAPLNEYASPATLTQEIAGARSRLAEMLGGLPAAFAFPFGAECELSRREVELAGFGFGLRSAHQAPCANTASFPFLPRIPGEWSSTDLRFVLSGLT